MRIEDAAWICHPDYRDGEPSGVRSSACSAFEARWRDFVSDDPDVQRAVALGYLPAMSALETNTELLRMFAAGGGSLHAARIAVNRALQALDEIERAIGDRE